MFKQYSPKLDNSNWNYPGLTVIVAKTINYGSISFLDNIILLSTL